MGIVYHSHYIVWFEIGRTEFCRVAGLPYSDMEAAGVFILVTGVACSYRRPARYDDALTVRTRMPELSSRGCAFEYEIRNAADDLLAEGATRHVFADTSGRLRRGPEEMVGTLERFRGGRST